MTCASLKHELLGGSGGTPSPPPKVLIFTFPKIDSKAILSQMYAPENTKLMIVFSEI